MNLTVSLEGHVGKVIEKLVEKGVVKTKSEALRLGILKLEETYLQNEELDDLIAAKTAWTEHIKGKNKALSANEFFKKTGIKA